MTKYFKILIFILFLNLIIDIILPSVHKNNLESQYFINFNQAENFRKKGEFLKAIEFFDKSLDVAKNISDGEKECESLMKLGLMHWNLGKLEQSSEYYKKALFIAHSLNLETEQKISQNAINIFILYNEGKKYRSSAQYQKSIESFKKAINISRRIGNKEHEVKCLRQLSATYWEMNNMQKFYSSNKTALKIAKELNHSKEIGRCLNNIGLFYWKLDLYSDALNYFQEALTISKKERNKSNEAELLNNIGIIYKDLGQYEKAIDSLEKALVIDKQLGDDIYISMDLSNIGETYRNNGIVTGNKEDFYKSLDYFNQCLELIKKTENKKIEIKVLNNIGTVYSDLEDYQQALQYFQLGYKKAEEIQDEEAMSILLNNMGIVHFNQGNYEESTKYYQKAIDLALEIRGGQILWEAYLELGKAYTKQKQYEKALESFKNSISIIEDIRSRIKLEELKASYLGTDKRIQAYHNLIHLLVHLHRSNPEKGFHSEAFNYLERAKARAFLDRLEISQVNISTGVNFKLQNREKELMKEISGLYTKLLAAELTPQEKHKIQEKLKSYEDKLETLKREIRTNSPAYADLKYPETITLQETQKNILDKKTAFFAYSIGEEYSYLFVITKNNLNIFPIPPRNKLQDQISDYLKVISDKENHDLQPGYDLYCSLVRPGLKKNLKNLIFVPDDILHFLPFEALITREKKKDWLIEKYRIAYVPSISSYREILQHKKMNKKDPPMNILAFGDPFFGHLETEENGGDIFQNFYSSTAFNFSRLKYSGHEIQGIGSLFKRKKTKFFLRNEATEEQLKEHNLADYKIIHFATHSLIDDQKPARSSIVLSLDEDPKEDGFLQMREVYNLELNADLVVLSACQTGLGQFIKGEGIEGLNRAFFYAGSSAVLMSLWSVNDQASSQLMERFYYHLRSSESIMDALRKTKLEMISSETLSHPFYWAGFIVSGKADEVIFSNRNHTYFFLGLSLLLGIGIIFVAVRKFAS